MNTSRALILFAVLTIVYLVALFWADARNDVFSALPQLSRVLPMLSAVAFVSYFVRYWRWQWLLRRVGHKFDHRFGFAAYLAGFAFTATPGKVGELVRARYLVPQGVPMATVISAFVYERAFDLVVVLMMASLAVTHTGIFIFVLVFVLAVVCAVIALSRYPGVLNQVAVTLRTWRLEPIARLCELLRDGLTGLRAWATPLDVGFSLLTGLFAWGLTTGSFVYLIRVLGIEVPLATAVAMLPLAMLAGAASMLPGGVGSAEATLVILLSLFDVPLGTATLAAVGIRLASMWFSILCGFLSVGWLERRLVRGR